MVTTQLDIFHALAEEADAELTGFTTSEEYTPEQLLKAFEAWKIAHGNFDSISRSHMWSLDVSNGHQGAHPWKAFVADLRVGRRSDDPTFQGPGGLVYRVYCFDCRWWTPIRSGDQSSPTIDYLDHCWHGWRDLPPIPFTKKNRMGAPHVSEIPDGYPEEWKVPGAPSINWANPQYTPPMSSRLHGVGKYSPFGGVGVTIHPNFDYPTLTRVTKEVA